MCDVKKNKQNDLKCILESKFEYLKKQKNTKQKNTKQKNTKQKNTKKNVTDGIIKKGICLYFNSKFGCNIESCEYEHVKRHISYKTNLCKYAHNNKSYHDKLCHKRCKFARNLKELYSWKYKDYTFSEIVNKTLLCSCYGIFHDDYCVKNCMFSKNEDELMEWINVYDILFNGVNYKL